MITHPVLGLNSQVVTCGKTEGAKLRGAFFATFLCEVVRKGTNPTRNRQMIKRRKTDKRGEIKEKNRQNNGKE